MKTYHVTLTITGIVQFERGGTVKEAGELAANAPFGTYGCGVDRGSYSFDPRSRSGKVIAKAKAVEVKKAKMCP